VAQTDDGVPTRAEHPSLGATHAGLALQLQGAFEVRLLRHRLVTSSPDGPGDDERRLDPALR
jgi:hypothetical protein